MLTDDQGREARTWLASIADLLGAAASLSSRAGERFDGTDMAVRFHDLTVAIIDFRDNGPAIAAAKTEAYAPAIAERNARNARGTT
jgi:hypothetical protein